jgi:hypothetical protein
VYCVLCSLRSFVCYVFFECGVLFCLMCVICVLCLIVGPLPPGKTTFAVNTINNNNISRNQCLLKYGRVMHLTEHQDNIAVCIKIRTR